MTTFMEGWELKRDARSYNTISIFQKKKNSYYADTV